MNDGTTRAAAPLVPSRPFVAAVVAAGVAAACVTAGGQSPRSVGMATIAALLVWLSALDLDYRLLPNRIVLPAAFAAWLVQVVPAPGRAPALAAAALGAAVFFLVFALAKPGGLGMGDVKLALLLGVVFGRSVVTILALGCFAAAVFAVAVVVVEGRSGLRRTIPLAPFMAFAAIGWIIATGA